MILSEESCDKDMNELKKEFIQLGINFRNITSMRIYEAPSFILKNVGFVQLFLNKK